MILADLLKVVPSCEDAAAVDLSSADVPLAKTRRLYIGVSGDVKVDMVGGETAIVFKAVPVGFLDVRASKVYKTGTTATNLVNCW